MRWIFRELGDALEFFVIPFLLALLPWWLGFRLVHWVAYLPFYNAGVARCFDNAVELGLASRAHKAEWVRACRASQLVDIVDIYLCLFRGNRFLDRYVQTNFDDKGLQQQLLVSFPHYGAGLWLYRYLHRLGLRSNLLINPLKKKPFFVRPFFRTLSYRLRVYVLTQHCGVNIISPGDMASIRQALRENELILVSADMPRLDKVKSYQPQTEFGRLNVTASFFDLAARRDILACNMVLGLDLRSGQRQYFMDEPQSLSAEAQAQRFASLSVAAIKQQSYLWRMLLLKNEVLIND